MMDWVRTNTAAYKFQNPAGVKVWLAKGMTCWVLHLGDDVKEELPIYLSPDTAQKVACRRLSAYLTKLISKIKRLT